MHIDHYSLPVYDKNNSDNTLKETELFKEVPYLSARLGSRLMSIVVVTSVIIIYLFNISWTFWLIRLRVKWI